MAIAVWPGFIHILKERPMKRLLTAAVAGCMALAMGGVLAQDKMMKKDTMGKGEMKQDMMKDDMKKKGDMKKDMAKAEMKKAPMAKDTKKPMMDKGMEKKGGMMKDEMKK
jgi:pentapeptide MXKDX repeat protein